MASARLSLTREAIKSMLLELFSHLWEKKLVCISLKFLTFPNNYNILTPA